MIKLWQRYKPFINAGVQELITYRVNFILYRIGYVMGAFVAFYLWEAVFDSSHEPLSSSFWSRLFIFPSSNTYNIIVISAITAATLSVTFGLNVKNILSNINIGTARSADPAKYLPIETGKSADTFPV